MMPMEPDPERIARLAEVAKQATAFTLLFVLMTMGSYYYFRHVERIDNDARLLEAQVQEVRKVVDKIEINQQEVLRLLRK